MRGVTGFLLTARCAMDDVPLGLFADEDAAETFAENFSPGDVSTAADVVLGIPRTTRLEVYCLQLTHFIRGYPQRTARIIKTFPDGMPQASADAAPTECVETEALLFDKKNRPNYRRQEMGGGYAG